MGGLNHSQTLNSCWVSLDISREYFNYLNNLMKSVTFGILFSDIKDLILTQPWAMSSSQFLNSETLKKNCVNRKDKDGRFHETFLIGKGCLYNMCLIFILSITFVKINFKQSWNIWVCTELKMKWAHVLYLLVACLLEKWENGLHWPHTHRNKNETNWINQSLSSHWSIIPSIFF